MCSSDLAIINGFSNTISSGADYSVVLGRNSATVTASSTTYMGYVNINNLKGTTPVTPLSVDTNGNVVSGTTPNYAFVHTPSGIITPTNVYANTINSGSTYSTIGGGKSNTISSGGQYATIGGGQNNSLTGDSRYSSIVGGMNNIVSNYGSVVCGGGYNIASGILSFVGGGGSINSNYSNRATDIFSSVVGGKDNRVDSYYSTIGGGYANTIIGNGNTRASFIGNGLRNTISGSSRFSSIISGRYNNLRHDDSHIVGSYINSISANTTHVEKLNIKTLNGTTPVTPLALDANGMVVDGLSSIGPNNLATKITNSTVANTTTETTLLGTPVGSYTLPTNFLTIGKTLRFKASGFISTAGSAGNMTLRFKFGATNICVTPSFTATNNLSQQLWKVDVVVTCRTTGASGTVFGQGRYGRYTVSNGNRVSVAMVNTATTTINTTTTNTVNLTVQWGTASASNTITCTNAVL